mmetsp:Transcript_186/g.715  ORF Transcript_186/g.715 Transcript_186/m.715 type:complete len:365 (-) Transcript_186:381-1475(-)
MKATVLTLALTVAPVAAATMHPDRVAEIAEIESKTSLWKAGATRFSPFAPGHGTKWMTGVLGDVKAHVAGALATGKAERFKPQRPELDIPEEFDVATEWPQCAVLINDIRDQSNCGCCWAFGGAEAASDRLCIATNASIVIPLSAQDVCFNSNKNGCGGGQITTPFTYLKETGVVSGGQYNNSGPFGAGMCSDFSLPHCHHHGPQGDDPYPAEGDPGCPSQRSPPGPTACDDDAETPHDDFVADKYFMDKVPQVASGEEAIQRMIMEGGSVETAFTTYSDFENYVSGIYQHVTGAAVGGHAVKFVGWGVEDGTKYWKVANSWNPYWGENGYFRIVRGVNECGIEDEVSGSASDATWSRNTKNLN